MLELYIEFILYKKFCEYNNCNKTLYDLFASYVTEDAVNIMNTNSVDIVSKQ